MNLIDNINLVFPFRRRIGYLLHNLPDIIYTIVGRSINLNHIHAGSCCNRLTNPAFSAGAVLRGVFTVYHLCKYLCDSSLSGPSGACKQICMADTIRPKLILQGGHNMILPLYISKPCRAKLSVKCRV